MKLRGLLYLEQRLAPQPTVENTSVKNGSLSAARRAKNDEFYTQLTDIEKELRYYKAHFKGQVVLCNCDDPDWSSFWKYFKLNFEVLGLAKLISTHYALGESSYKLEYLGKHTPPVKTPLTCDGDFRSDECVALLKQADIVVTNPPFSLFREYVSQLVEHDKKFLVIGSQNALTYKEVFRLIRANKIWLGNTKPKEFEQPDGSIKAFGNIGWYTNLAHSRRNEDLVLFKAHAGNEAAYPKYDNYDAIEVSRVVDIPVDYAGVMGVPITFLDKYNPSQFEIVWLAAGNTRASTPKVILDELGYIKHKEDRGGCPVINGKRTYGRILIRYREGSVV